jgi:hypothetical protein
MAMSRIAIGRCDTDIRTSSFVKREALGETGVILARYVSRATLHKLPLAELVHHVNGSSHMFDRGIRQDPVAQIKDMTGPTRSPPQNVFDPAFDFMERREQHHRIEIPLHGHIMADRGPGLIEMNPPIYPQHVTAGLAHLPENG